MRGFCPLAVLALLEPFCVELTKESVFVAVEHVWTGLSNLENCFISWVFVVHNSLIVGVNFSLIHVSHGTIQTNKQPLSCCIAKNLFLDEEGHFNITIENWVCLRQTPVF